MVVAFSDPAKGPTHEEDGDLLPSGTEDGETPHGSA
jgi:hypothetical protein